MVNNIKDTTEINAAIINLNFSGINLQYDSNSECIVASLRAALKSVPDVEKLHTRILLQIIQNQAMEINRFESKSSNIDYIHETYKIIQKQLTKELKKTVNLENNSAIRSSYFDLRDTLKEAVQQVEHLEHRLKLRKGAAKPK